MQTLESQALEHGRLIRELDTYQALLVLSTLDEVSKDEVRSLIKMLTSVDKENHTVAREAIDQLIKKITL